VRKLLLFVLTLPALDAAGFHLLKTIPYGAAEGGREYFDYVNVDSAARRAYLSHGTEFLVVDADSGALIGKISGLKRDHGVALVPDLNRGFITDGDAAQIAVFDLKTLKTTGNIKGENDADSILYEPVSKRVFVFNGDPQSSTVIDPARLSVVATLPLGGSPEQAVADGKGMIYANIESTSEVIALDARSLKIVSRFPTAPVGHPVSISMDRATRRLFIGGRDPKLFAMMNAGTGKIVGDAFPIGARVDSNIFDAELKIAACATGDGTIHVFHEDSPEKMSLVETVTTEYGAKTMGLDEKTHHLLVDTSDFETVAASGKQKGPQRRAKPGTFHLLIYGR